MRAHEAQGAAAHPNPADPGNIDPGSSSASACTSGDDAAAAAAAALRSELRELRCAGEREHAAAAAETRGLSQNLAAARREAAERAAEVDALAALSLRGDATVQECMARLRVASRTLTAFHEGWSSHVTALTLHAVSPVGLNPA